MPSPHVARILTAIALAVASPYAGAQKVWVVAGAAGPGVDFTSLSDAASVAASGDLVLVRDGTYLPFELNGKGLSIVEDAGADARIGASGSGHTLAVRHTSALQPTWLHGLRYLQPIPPAWARLEAEQCDGLVLLSDVDWSIAAVHSNSEAPTLRVASCSNLVLASCSLIGRDGFQSCYGGSGCVCFPQIAAAAFWLDDSSAAAFDCVVRGGDAAAAKDPTAPCGAGAGLAAMGARLQSSRLLLQSAAHGGDGGAGAHGTPIAPCVWSPSCGQSGVTLVDATSELVVAGGSVSAGQPGAVVAQGCPPPNCATPAIAGPGSTITQAPLPKLELPPIAREGQSITAKLSAAPGVAAFVVGTAVDAVELVGVAGWWLASGSTAVVLLGPVAPDGSVTRTFVVSELGAGVDFHVMYVQAAHCGSSGACALGVARPIALLDSAF